MQLCRKLQISHMRLNTWIQKLSQYNLVIEWRAGTDPLMSPSDAMTRLTKLIKAPETQEISSENLFHLLLFLVRIFLLRVFFLLLFLLQEEESSTSSSSKS
jgi:hypothetical protein